MKISYNPKSSLAAVTSQTAANDDIIFDLYASKLWVKGVRIGADWTDISNKPSSLKNPYALTINLNGTSQGPYDGSAAKNINITPGSIGAATSNHNHDGRYVYNYGGTANVNGQTLNQNALFMSTTSGITGDWWHILQAAGNGEYRWNSQIAFPTQNRNGMYYRSGLSDNTGWGDWVKLLDISNSYVENGKGYINNTEITQTDNATKLQTARSLWGNSFDGTKDISGSIIFPDITDTAISSKISWSGSTDGADIYYQTTAKNQGNLVLNVRDDTNAYIQLALNGVFKSHFDVVNSYWTGRSAQADKWTTARTFTIGNTAKNIDGSGNMIWTLAEIGAASSGHTHTWNSLTHTSTTENQAILTNGKANGWKLQTLNIVNWDNAANNSHTHTNKSVLDGITSALVSSWNTAYTFVDTITKDDTDKIINKWDEIVNFLEGINSDNKLNTLLNSKLSIQQLSANDILTTKTNNALFWVDTQSNAATIKTGPFTDNPYALLSITNYDQNSTNNKNFYRSRLAFSSVGDIKVASCHYVNKHNQDDTWYNVLTSKNSGIDGTTITLNGTSITVYDNNTADNRYVLKSGDAMSGNLTINTANLGALTIQRNDNTNGAAIQFRGKSNIYGHIGFNNDAEGKQLLRWGTGMSTGPYTILDTSSTYTSSDGKGTINGVTITKVDNATSADAANKITVNQSTDNDDTYPLVWSDQNNTYNITANQLYKSWNHLYYNPRSMILTVKGSISTSDINTVNIKAMNTVTSAGFIHSGVTENANQYVLTANGGYTPFNQISNESVYEFSKDITVLSYWTDIDGFYGNNQNFLTQSGTYIVQVYYNETSADGVYEGYFSGIMSWYTGKTKSNSIDEIILHRAGNVYSDTIYLRTKQSLSTEQYPYTKLQISANTRLINRTYKFKFKRIC